MSLFTLGSSPARSPEIHGWVAPGATVIGNVRIAAGASVWFNAVIRGDNDRVEIGADANIQDGCILHLDAGYPLTVGANTTVGHRAILHGCTVGSDCVIGMGAIIMNGAVIGDGSLVGAGALVPEGRVFPPGSLIIGAPASVKRPLKPEEIDGLRANGNSYAVHARRYQTELRVK